MTVKQFCEKYNLTEGQYYGSEKVGGGLYLSSLTSIPTGFNPTVGGYLDLPRQLQDKVQKNPIPKNYVFNWGKHCKIDGIFTEVLSRKGQVWKVKKIGASDTMFVVTDNNGKYAHGSTIKEAKDSLIYKITSRDTSRYAGMSLETVLTYEASIEMYRVITGACAAGTRSYIESINPEKRDYSIKEIITLTSGQWGNDTLKAFVKGKIV